MRHLDHPRIRSAALPFILITVLNQELRDREGGRLFDGALAKIALEKPDIIITPVPL